MITQNNKQAQIDWERFRQNVRRNSAVNLNETAGQKAERIRRLEADPQAWKEYYFEAYFKYGSPGFHITASKRLHENFKAKKHWYEVRHWARGLSKSTTMMFDILYFVMTGVLKNILMVSSTYEAAELFLTKYQVQLDSNQKLINDYGKHEMPGFWSMGSFTTRGGAKFLAVGGRQTPRGNGNQEIRPDAIIVDDFDTDEECRNPDIITQKWDWFEKALFFTVDTSEAYLIIWLGNIIAPDCCVVRAGKKADYCEIINIRGEDGLSVWPEKNSEEDIQYQIDKVDWASSQQELFNNPVREGQIFKEMNWGKCPPLNQCELLVIYADPATSNKDKPSTKSKSQNSCKAVILEGKKGLNFYVYKCFVDNTSNSKFIDWLFAMKKLVNNLSVYIFIENNSLQDPFYEQVFLPLIHQKSKEFGFALPITPDTRAKPEKFFRIEASLEPLNRLKNLVLNIDEKDDPDMKRLEAQFKSVSPNSKTMDGPDAVEGATHILKTKSIVKETKAATIFQRKPNNKRF